MSFFIDWQGLVFSVVDFVSGYHQMRMAVSSKQFTAFCAGTECYHWWVAPMGLAVVPGTWSRLMRRIFETEELSCFVVIYLDDICIFSKSLNEHVLHLRRVFQILREEKLYARPSKCHFARSSIRFLGHVIGGDGIHVDPDKTAALTNWPTPYNVNMYNVFPGCGWLLSSICARFC